MMSIKSLGLYCYTLVDQPVAIPLVPLTNTIGIIGI